MKDQNLEAIELISFKLCPYAQRSAIALLKQGIEFETTHIDLANKPDWFSKISPTGKVPVLRFGDEALFESAAINEFVNEISDGSLLPDTAVARAKARAQIVTVDKTLTALFNAIGSQTAADAENAKGPLLDLLTILENGKHDGPFYMGEKFSLVDAAIAPLFVYLNVCNQRFGLHYLSGFPELQKLSDHLISQDYVQKSTVAHFEEELVAFLQMMQSYLTT